MFSAEQMAKILRLKAAYDMESIEQCWCLVAVSGDLSSTGMSETSTCIVLMRDNKCVWDKAIVDYLAKQLVIKCHDASTQGEKKLFAGTHYEDRGRYKIELWDLYLHLVRLGIFTSKYDNRTEWLLVEYEQESKLDIFKDVAFRWVVQPKPHNSTATRECATQTDELP
jgi:hypothetical protein